MQRPLPDNTNIYETHMHDPGEIRTHGWSKRASIDRRLDRATTDSNKFLLELRKDLAAGNTAAGFIQVSFYP